MNQHLPLTLLFLVIILFSNGQNPGVKIGANYAMGKMETHGSSNSTRHLGGI